MGQEAASPMGQGMMGGGTMGRGMMGPPRVMLHIMFALIDTDSDGTISLQEFQATHERIFKAMDTNKDGKLTLEEMEAHARDQVSGSATGRASTSSQTLLAPANSRTGL
jgi:EF hand